MSRTKVRAEDLFCARCGRAVRIGAAHWPEGYLCSTCRTRAVETYGRCDGCGVERLTPGIAPGGGRLCTDCAGGLGDFHCECCGREALRYRRGICGHCVLAEQLHELLDDGTGAVRGELLPLFETVRQMSRPRNQLSWIAAPHVQLILRALATGQVPLTHDGLSELSPPRAVAHIRDLLMASGVLTTVDRHLVLFERWLPQWLGAVDNAEHRRLLERFATWHVLRRLRTSAAAKPLGPGKTKNARAGLVQAAAFLVWLTERGRDIGGCTQADLDAWHAEKTITRRAAQAFLRWCADNRAMPRLKIPTHRTENPAPIDQHRRIALIRRILTDDQLPPADRVAAALVLLYAQPVSRLVRLTADDVVRDGEQVTLRLGDPATPVPEPFAGILLDHLATRPDSTWLFPGHRAGQSLDPATLRGRLTAAGIPTLHGRTAAIRQLVLQAPPSVVAGMLGYHSVHAEAVAAEAGGTWKKYAPGDHTR